jgi:phytoene dehydrogenase-like protein
MAPEVPALFLLMVLGYLERGYLSRPVGGTAAFRDALIGTYARLGGASRTHATVDEVLVRDKKVVGVRTSDGGFVEADVVISTSSAPETVLRLLGGRYGADDVRRRLEHWKLIPPIVMVSLGVELPLAGAPAMLFVDGIEPFEVGGRLNDRLYVRVYHDDPAFAPAGHAVVQALLETDYAWWATTGTRYESAKDAAGTLAIERLEPHFPGLRDAVRMVDVVTPLTYWNQARSWRGAYEGWMPSNESFFGHVRKTLPGLSRFYMAGQWVEPGGGVPTALMSGRQVVQLLCADEGHTFVASPATRPA